MRDILWQDVLIFVISFALYVVLIPQLYSCVNDKMKLNTWSALLTAIVLLILSFIYVTLNLNIAFTSVYMTSMMWFMLWVLSADFKFKG